MIAHCLFEQSGTFKNEFLKLGIKSYDYDIKDDYGQTDFIIDLFEEINICYEHKNSIFDNFKPDDIIIAFFPCTYFECQSHLWFNGNNFAQSKWSIKQKCQNNIIRHIELNKNYILLNKLVYICIDRNLKLVIENPYTQPHYLNMYWSLKPSIIDKDRTKNGDFYKKPTQYWFIGFKPYNNLVFESLEYVEIKKIDKTRNVKSRSLIHPQYANRFIRQYLININSIEK